MFRRSVWLVALCIAGVGCSGEPSVLVCGEGEERCGSSCAELASDPRHCGACGVACVTGEVCAAGQCQASCPVTQAACGGGCFTLASAPGHCGACGQSCAAGQVCADGACRTSCPEGQLACGGGCFNVSSSPEHCGGCDQACDSGLCIDGRCETRCTGSLTLCGESCRDTRTDPAHCGGCDTACATGQACINGNCEVFCGAGVEYCEGVGCRDLKRDRGHCGGCDRPCAPDAQCIDGACEVSCPSGLLRCGDSCRDTRADPANCGACGTACGSGELCTAGECVLSCTGFAGDVCDGSCTNLQFSSAHCGACDEPCGLGEVCSAGGCVGPGDCAPPNAVCSRGCTSPRHDPANCGACGQACAQAPGSVAFCHDGTCGAICQPGQGDCDGDLLKAASNGCETALGTTVENCGACGVRCAPLPRATAACVAGACGLGVCEANFSDCDGDPANGCETDLRVSAPHCGACNSACPAGQVCGNGTCTFPTGESCDYAMPIVSGLNTIAWTASSCDYLTAAPSCGASTAPSGPDIVLQYDARASGPATFTVAKPASNRWHLVASGTCGVLTPALGCVSEYTAASMTASFPVTAGSSYWLHLVDTTSGTLPLSNPLTVTVGDCFGVALAASGLSPAPGSISTSLSPVISFTANRPLATGSGELTLTGNLGTRLSYPLPSSAVAFSNLNKTVTLTLAAPLPVGERVAVSWTDLADAVCPGVSLAAPLWEFDVPVPPCTPGTGGMVGTTHTRFPTGLPVISELYVGADAMAGGYVYVGAESALYRMPKAGGAVQAVHTLAGLTKNELGRAMVIDGDSVYTVKNTDLGSGVLWRITDDAGATWTKQDMAVFSPPAADWFQGAAAHGGLLHLITSELTLNMHTEIWTVNPAASASPVAAVKVLSFGAGQYRYCSGLGVDAASYYTTCQTANQALHAVLRIDRATGAVTQLTTAVPSNFTMMALQAADHDLDGVADQLYVQSNSRVFHYVCGLGQPTPYADILARYGATGVGTYGLAYDSGLNAIWVFDDATREFVKFQ